MKIILSNYRYFISGGPERYLFAIQDLLKNKGNEVFPFSVKSKNNIPNNWEDYFLSPLTNDDSVYFHEYKKNLKTIVKVIERSFYSPEGFFKAKKYAKKVKADILYSLHFLNKMSPSVLDGFKSAGLPVIVRISDFELICPQALLLKKGKNCNDCIDGSFFKCVHNKCVKNSFTGSLLKAIAWNFHRMIGSISRIDAFICPSKFTKKKYIEAGYPADKIYHIPTFINITNIEPKYSKGDYVLYFGRISEEKGIHVLLKAFDLMNTEQPKLIIIGNTTSSEYSKSLKEKYHNKVKFIDFLPKKKLFAYIRNASFVVVPSIWYENMPNVILESFAHGKPVIASDNGGIPDLVKHYHTGLLFETGNANSLSAILSLALKNSDEIVEMGKNARAYVERHLSPDIHFSKLLKLFSAFL